MYIIVKNKPHRFGKTRSEHEKNIRREWGCKTLSDEALDKCKYLEKKSGVKKSFFDQSQIGKVR
jgi:hypothetical protein